MSEDCACASHEIACVRSCSHVRVRVLVYLHARECVYVRVCVCFAIFHSAVDRKAPRIHTHMHTHIYTVLTQTHTHTHTTAHIFSLSRR